MAAASPPPTQQATAPFNFQTTLSTPDWCKTGAHLPTLLHRLPGRRAMEHDDKLEPQGDGCTKSALNKMHKTPCGDHLEVRG